MMNTVNHVVIDKLYSVHVKHVHKKIIYVFWKITQVPFFFKLLVVFQLLLVTKSN